MAILQKYNWKFDFETDKLNIPIDASIFKKYDINAHEYVIAFIAVAVGQMYDPKKVTFKYELNGFYLDIFIEQLPFKTGILFVRHPGQYTDAQIETVKDLCHALGIRLIFVYLYDEMDSQNAYTDISGVIRVSVEDDEKLENLDLKTKDLFAEVFGALFPKLLGQFDEIYGRLDTQLCYRLGILLSLNPKQEPAPDQSADYKDYVMSMSRV